MGCKTSHVVKQNGGLTGRLRLGLTTTTLRDNWTRPCGRGEAGIACASHFLFPRDDDVDGPLIDASLLLRSSLCDGPIILGRRP